MRDNVPGVKDTEDLRYPVGRFQPPASSTPGMRAAQIETLRLLPERLRAAVAGLDDAQLDTPYRDGGWTLRQVVHHLADSHANSAARFKLALYEWHGRHHTAHITSLRARMGW